MEKEGLACVFGVRRFYSYLFGYPFDLITDHKPLLGLLGEYKPTSPQASARIRRWSLYLSMFEYTMKFRGTAEHGNADALSRLPLPEQLSSDHTPPELVLLAEHLENSPVTADQIRRWTEKDPDLAAVLQFTKQGWPRSLDRGSSQLKPFFCKRSELSVYNGCLLWGTRVVVPKEGREAVLHEGHPGMERMKSLARMYVWWPGISSDIEDTVRGCPECQWNQAAPPAAPLHPWSWPTRPWARLHLDFAGPVQGKMYLILIDAHSKWIEAFCTPNATSLTVIEQLRAVFARFGLPETVVTDNGTCFVSSEFEVFLQRNGIKHLTSAPYHPASNGLAERAVQIIKKGLKKTPQGSASARLATTLMAYRLTPQSTTGISPAEMLLGRQPRSRLDLLKPHTADRVENSQLRQKKQHDARAKDRELRVGDRVFVRNYHQGDRWLLGTIQAKTGPVSFLARLEDGRERRCHQDQLRLRTVEVEKPRTTVECDVPVPPAPEPRVLTPEEQAPPEAAVDTGVAAGSSAVPDDLPVAPAAGPPLVSEPPESVGAHPEHRSYPRRTRNPVDRYEPTW